MSEKTKLVPAMIAKADKVIELLQPEMANIGFVTEFEALIPKDGILNFNQLEVLSSKFLLAFDMCKDAAAVCSALASEAKRRLEKEKALARLERSTDYFKKTDTSEKSITDKAREAYISIDAGVDQATLIYNKWRALGEYFDQSVKSFELWHNWAKKLFDRDISSTSHAQKERSL